jgi:hypothetical protein
LKINQDLPRIPGIHKRFEIYFVFAPVLIFAILGKKAFVGREFFDAYVFDSKLA